VVLKSQLQEFGRILALMNIKDGQKRISVCRELFTTCHEGDEGLHALMLIVVRIGETQMDEIGTARSMPSSLWRFEPELAESIPTQQ
jgi:hypothetical protein